MTASEDQNWEDALHNACFPVSLTDVKSATLPSARNGIARSCPTMQGAQATRLQSSPIGIA